MEEKIKTDKVIRFIKPDRWVYCKKGDLKSYENLLVEKNFIVGFDKPILEVQIDKVIAVRTEDEVALLDFEGKIIWKKKVKANAIAVHNDKVAIGYGKKIEIFNINGERIFKKRVGRVRALDFDDKISVVATDKGLKCFFDKSLLWESDIEVNLIKLDYVVGTANYDEFILLTRDGHILWKKKLDNIVYDIDFERDGITVYTLGNRIKFGFEGNVKEVVNEMYDFKFLPYPQIVLERKIRELNELLKSSKGIEKKEVKRLIKEAKKVFNKGLYGESYELLKKALEELKKAQLIVKIPKKVKINKEFNITLSYKNVLHDNVENLVVDITDFEKYFDVEQKIVEFPPVRRGMIVRKDVKAYPKFEGLFKLFINAKSNVDEIGKEIEINVVKRRFSLPMLRKEKEEFSFEDLLK